MRILIAIGAAVFIAALLFLGGSLLMTWLTKKRWPEPQHPPSDRLKFDAIRREWERKQ